MYFCCKDSWECLESHSPSIPSEPFSNYRNNPFLSNSHNTTVEENNNLQPFSNNLCSRIEQRSSLATRPDVNPACHLLAV